MFYDYSKVGAMVRIVAIVLFLILSTGCGGSSSTSVTNTITTTRYPQEPDGSFDIPGLLHIASSVKDPGTCDHIVLATDRLTYDSGELQQMEGYFAGNSSSLPNTLTMVHARFLDSRFYSKADCQTALEITNIAQEPIQITEIGVKLTTDSEPNKGYYRLVNSCTFFPSGSCGRGGGTEPDGHIYTLGSARKDTVFRDVDPEIVHSVLLKSGDTSVNLLAFVPEDASGYLSYSLIPELILSTSTGGSQVFDLVQLMITVSFIRSDQSSYYQLHGDTLVPVVPSSTP